MENTELTLLQKPEPSHQVRVSLSGGINPASPRVLRPTLPLGRMVSQVMLPLCKPIRSQPSGGNWRALRGKGRKKSVKKQTFDPAGQMFE